MTASPTGDPFGPDSFGPDPFGTGALRDGVLAAWRGSPTRFREDANAEEDLALGGYADRLLVELAQNAADAAQRAGTPGRLSVSVADGELRAANTGEPLSAAGVSALASLRASAKREGTNVGRFGVGFAAVLAVTDEPRIVSTTGGVAFSARRTSCAVAGDPALRAELDRRARRPPVLRLAWPVDAADPTPPPGFDTEVRLPLRPGVAAAGLLARCAEQAAELLLALPWLVRIDVGDRAVVREHGDPVLVRDGAAATRWRLVRRHGRLGGDALAGLGVEAAERPEWTVCWALPVDDSGGPVPLGEDALHAPTRTDERLTLPARLIATLPVEPSRRRVAPGPAADAVLDAAAAAYPELAAALPAAERTALVPAPGFPASDLDAALRERLLAALRTATWLPAADGSLLAPVAATVLDSPSAELAAALAGVVSGLTDAELAAARHASALAALGVPRLRPADIADAVAGLDRPPAWWRALYSALAPRLDADPAAAEELGALPVPLADGRTVTGPRGVLLGHEELPGLPAGELRMVHPDAAHPLLQRLGARPVDAAGLLEALRPAVERSVADAEAGLDLAPLADAVLALAGRAGGTRWLGALALPDAGGEPRRADELLLPDAALRPLLAPGCPLGVLDAAVAAAHPREALRAAGVLDGFAVLDDPEPAGPHHDLDGEHEWWTAVGADVDPPDRLLGVRDLDLVDDAAWPAALRLLAADPATAAALRQPGGYTPWWLARHARLGGHPPTAWRLPAAASLAGLYDPVPDLGVPPDLLAAAGVRTRLAVTGPHDAADLLDRLADPGRTPTPAAVRAAHAALTAAGIDPDDVDPPARVRAISAMVTRAEDAVVLDRPWLAAVCHPDRCVAGGDPEVLADLLDLPLASETVRGELVSSGREVAWAELAEVAAACEAIGAPVPEGTLLLHQRLVVSVGGAEHAVPSWVDDDGRIHAADPLRALLHTGLCGVRGTEL